MEHLLILNEIGDLMFLEIVIDEIKQLLNQIVIFISTIKQNSPHLKQYEAEKGLLIELIKKNSYDGDFFSLKHKLLHEIKQVNFLANFENARRSSESVFTNLFESIREKLYDLTKDNKINTLQAIASEKKQELEEKEEVTNRPNKKFLKSFRYINKKNKQWKCRKCKKNFKSLTQRFSHNLKFHKYSKLKIERNRDSFLFIEKFDSPNQSIKIEIDEYFNNFNCPQIRHRPKLRPKRCKKCGKKFSTFPQWIHHLKIHQKITAKLFQCQKCEKLFKFESRLRNHILKHSIKEKPLTFSCTYCHKIFPQLGNLTTHLRIHTKEKPYECEECGKKFSDSGNFSRHKRIHSKEKPYACDQCEKSFSQTNHLYAHRVTHTKERPFECEQCGKRFTQQASLSVHKRCHLEKKPFACDQCEKSFSQRENLKAHKMKHSGEKPYACDECERKFIQQSHLKAHKLRIHSQRELLSCDLCEKNFKQSNHLARHKKTHHNATGNATSYSYNQFGLIIV